jgi:hypothetical protein
MEGLGRKKFLKENMCPQRWTLVKFNGLFVWENGPNEKVGLR